MPGMVTRPTTVIELRIGIIPVRTASATTAREASQRLAPKASSSSTSRRPVVKPSSARSTPSETPVSALPSTMPRSGMKYWGSQKGRTSMSTAVASTVVGTAPRVIAMVPAPQAPR